ncbi:hypothetical protein M9434_001105 [Picochlorum sp. BPE23]|nr:hypothetical protein M9434_001105 [Picochlorum sp. BPE23]
MSSFNSYVVILLVSTAILAGVCYGQDIATGSVINSGVTIDENGVTIGGSTPSFSGPPLTFECLSGCISQSYSPVIFTRWLYQPCRIPARAWDARPVGLFSVHFIRTAKSWSQLILYWLLLQRLHRASPLLVGRRQLTSSQRAMAACLLCGLVLVQFCC